SIQQYYHINARTSTFVQSLNHHSLSHRISPQRLSLSAVFVSLSSTMGAHSKYNDVPGPYRDVPGADIDDKSIVTKPLPSWPLCNLIEHLTVHFSLVHFCTYSNAHSITISYHVYTTLSQSYY